MSFRVKVRIKNLKLPKIDPSELARLIEVARARAEDVEREKERLRLARLLRWPKGNECVPVPAHDWHRRYGHGNISYPGPNPGYLWNGPVQ